MTNNSEEKISLLPESARQDYQNWKSTGDEASLQRLVAHLFAFHEVPDFEIHYAEKGDEVVILQDLEVDSLTLAEILFFAEDLLGIRISNEEVQQMRTVGDLKRFISHHRTAD